MQHKYKATLYNFFIDPLLAGLKRTVAENSAGASKVIDVACGTGTLACEIASAAEHVTGIDLDEGIISFASRRALNKGIQNVTFEVRDAVELTSYGERVFDAAVTSMSVHQFNEELAVRILAEMKRIARKVIIADYNCPMEAGLSSVIACGIERMARGDHYRNFRNYMQKGGIRWFTGHAGLEIRNEIVKSNGVFVVVICE